MQSEVGIFFLFGDQLHVESTPLSGAKPYGDFLGHAGGRDSYFDRLVESKKVPEDREYIDVPRGTVVFFARSGEFMIYRSLRPAPRKGSQKDYASPPPAAGSLQGGLR